MLFRDSFLTNAGVAILARATGQEGAVVWTRAATTDLDTDDKTASQMDRLTEEDLGTKTSSGVVTNVVVDDARQSVAIHCELTNSEYYGMARTLGVWAKIQGDAQDVLVVVARCGEGVTPTYINPASEGEVKAFVDFSLEITDEQAQAVSVAEGYYATSSALQDEVAARESLAGRVVTTHSAANTGVGDGQNILGWKSFHSLPMMIGDLDATGNWIFADYIPMIMAGKGKCKYSVYNDNYNNINSIYVSGHFYYNDTTKINHGVSAEDNAQTGEVTVTDYLKKDGYQYCAFTKQISKQDNTYIASINMGLNAQTMFKLYTDENYNFRASLKSMYLDITTNDVSIVCHGLSINGTSDIDISTIGRYNISVRSSSEHRYKNGLGVYVNDDSNSGNGLTVSSTKNLTVIADGNSTHTYFDGLTIDVRDSSNNQNGMTIQSVNHLNINSPEIKLLSTNGNTSSPSTSGITTKYTNGVVTSIYSQQGASLCSINVNPSSISMTYQSGIGKSIIFDSSGFHPGGTGAVDLGTSTYKWQKVHADEIHGALYGNLIGCPPYPTHQTGTSGISTPIGSIILVTVATSAITADTQIPDNSIGVTFSTSDSGGIYRVGSSSYNTSTQALATDMTFVALQTLNWQVATIEGYDRYWATFLAMRIS